MKYIILILTLISINTYAANDVLFKTELTGDQKEEHVKITIDGKLACELNAKPILFGYGGSDECKFQPTKKVHRYTISGTLKTEDEKQFYQGKGGGLIINFYEEYKKLDSAKNIDDLFGFYDDGMKAINQELPKPEQLQKLKFSSLEKQSDVDSYMQQNDIALPKSYIKMITKYGYPQINDYVEFIPIKQQKSIADLYLDDYEYPAEYVNKHKGVEKNKGFFLDHDVYYVFHDHTKTFCEGEPVIDYTIMTEGDYSPIDTKNAEKSKICGDFFVVLKNQIMEIFINTITTSFSEYYLLPVYRNNTLEADLSYNWDGELMLEYYFEYNNIFY